VTLASQTRSFMYVDDCVEGIYRIMQSDYAQPLNLGSDELVSVDELVDIVASAACKQIAKRHDLTQPQGVRGRNSDNSRLECQHTGDQIADACVSPRDPHLQQLYSCRKQDEADALDQVAIGITKPKSKTMAKCSG
jgi:GDP-D-mannose dehydratase